MIPTLAAPVNHAADTGPKPRWDPAVFLLSPQVPFHFRSALPLVDGLPCFCFAISATDCRIETPIDAGISPCSLVFSCRILNDAHPLRCSALFALPLEGCGSGKVPAFSTKTAEFVEKAPAGPVLGSFWGQTPKFLRFHPKAKEKGLLQNES